MKAQIVIGFLCIAGLAFAAVTGTPSTSPTGVEVFDVLEGSTQQLTLGPFTREDGKTEVVPLEVSYRIDSLPASGTLTGTPTPLLPSQRPTPAATVVVSIPGSVLRYQPNGADCVLTSTWKWLPGQCSMTTTRVCNATVDCPGGESCERSIGQKESVLRIKRRRFPN